jgi:sec-independent protein translocase protein TatB
MFDLTSSKLLILGLVALIVVGPKDLPVLLRTIGKYLGLIRRQASEFRAQFDEAMRESELASLKSEMDGIKRDVSETVQSATSSIRADVDAASREIDNQIAKPATVIDDAAITAHNETILAQPYATSAPATNGTLDPALLKPGA